MTPTRPDQGSAYMAPALHLIGDLPLVTPRPVDELHPRTMARIDQIEAAVSRGDRLGAARLALRLEMDLGITNEDRIAAMAPTNDWEQQLEGALQRASVTLVLPPPGPTQRRRKPKPRRAKPKSPEQIAAEKAAARMQDFEAVGMSGSAASLANYASVEVIRTGERREERTVDHDLARRLDAFEALKSSMKAKEYAGAYDAARRLETDIQTRLGLGDKGHGMDRVDCQSRKDKTDAMLAAGEKVDSVLALMPDRDAWLLTEIISPSLPYPTWRAIVGRITGETQANAQGAVVRSACVNLREAYVKLERAKLERKPPVAA